VTVLFVVVGGALVFVIAAVVIGRETLRLSTAPPRPVFDVDEAVMWIADRLPPEVAGQLSHGDVRQLLLWSVEHLRILAAEDRVAEEDERFIFLVDQAVASGQDWSPAQVRAVLDAEAAYLEVIGAAGRDREVPPDGGGRPLPSSPPERGGGPTEE
jgi:hypothetical protein